MQQMSNVDDAIDRLEEYIDNPKLVTKQTLIELRDMLLGESENDMESEKDDSEGSESEAPGLVIAIGKKAKMKGGMDE